MAVGPIRRILDTLRAIPEIVFALMLIFVPCGGPVPAIVAIALHATGALGKVFSEVTENVPRSAFGGLGSVGASSGRRMLFGVLPQVTPNRLDCALLRSETDIRASAILGYVEVSATTCAT